MPLLHFLSLNHYLFFYFYSVKACRWLNSYFIVTKDIFYNIVAFLIYKVKMTQHNAGNVSISQLWNAICTSMNAQTPWYDIPLERENNQLPQYVDYNLFPLIFMNTSSITVNVWMVPPDCVLTVRWASTIIIQLSVLI
jgi:hypothetical protein